MVPSWFGILLAGVLTVSSTNALQDGVVMLSKQRPQVVENVLESQVKDLEKNVSDLWVYIYDLRHAMERHLTHLAQHQKSTETVLYKLVHQQHHGSDDAHHHGDDHHTSRSDSGHHHGDDHHTSHDDSGHHHGDDHHMGHDDSGHHHGDGNHTSHGDTGHHDHHHESEATQDHHDHHKDHEGSDHHAEPESSDHHHDHNDHHSSSENLHAHGRTDADHHHHTSDSTSHTDAGHKDDDHHDDHHHSDEHQMASSHDHHDGHQSSSSHDHHHDHGDHSSGAGQPHQDSHETHHDHKDSHEKGSDDQQTQSVEKLEDPIIATSHSHHHGLRDRNKPVSVIPEGGDPLNLLGGHNHNQHRHHHHHHHPRQEPTSTAVAIPKASDYKLYDYAVCDVQPNRAIAEELQQEVRGQVSLWQKKTGGPLNIHLRLQGFKIGGHHQHQMQDQEDQANEAPAHAGGHRHGFHVHESGDLSSGCQSTGAHYNPLNVNHGGPRAVGRHVGDFGNIECDDQGITNIVFSDGVASLTGNYSILGKALVIHADQDDYGLAKDNAESLLTGNAGTRIACCVIQRADRLPLKFFKAIKIATQYRN